MPALYLAYGALYLPLYGEIPVKLIGHLQCVRITEAFDGACKTGRIDLICHERLHVSVMQRPSGLSKGVLSIWLAFGYCGCPAQAGPGPRSLIMLDRWPAGCDNHFQWVMRCSHFEPWFVDDEVAAICCGNGASTRIRRPRLSIPPLNGTATRRTNRRSGHVSFQLHLQHS